MLILTRRVGETLVINDNITLTVLGVKGNQVRIGVNAPKGVEVHREEIWQRIQKEREIERTCKNWLIQRRLSKRDPWETHDEINNHADAMLAKLEYEQMHIRDGYSWQLVPKEQAGGAA